MKEISQMIAVSVLLIFIILGSVSVGYFLGARSTLYYRVENPKILVCREATKILGPSCNFESRFKGELNETP